MPSLIAVLCLWAAWFSSWMLTRLWAKPTVAAPKPGSQRLYNVFLFVGSAMLFVQDPHIEVHRLWSLPPVANWSLVAVAAAGFGVCWWARIYMGRTWSWGITRKEDHQIVDTGPYALVRHPIYGRTVRQSKKFTAHDQNGEADRRFGCGDSKDEEHEDLAGRVAEIMREGDEINIHGQQHQLDRHQQNDDVAAVQEDPDHADREQDRAQHQIMLQ